MSLTGGTLVEQEDEECSIPHVIPRIDEHVGYLFGHGGREWRHNII